jgi:hypothetical protein
VEKKFYQQALARAIIEELNETPEEQQQLQEYVSMMQERAERYDPQPDPEKLAWFQELPNAVTEFAKNCNLDVYMTVSNRHIGSIVFETSYLELSAFDDPVVPKFWMYLCEHGQLTIAQKKEVFSMEFRFDLRAR